MASEAKVDVKVTGAPQAEKQNEQLAKSFTGVSKATKQANKDFSSLNTQARKSANAVSDVRGEMTKLAGQFLTFEVVKRMTAFAGTTLRAAENMKGLSGETKVAASNYTDMVDSTFKVGENIVFWLANLGTASGTMTTLRDLAKETADSWAYMAGNEVSATIDNMAKNADALSKAELIRQVDMLRTTQAEMKKYKDINQNYFEVASAGVDESIAKVTELGRAMKLTEDQIKKLITSGESVSSIVKGKPKSKPSSSVATQGEAYDPTKQFFDEYTAAIDFALKNDELREENRKKAKEAQESANQALADDDILFKQKLGQREVEYQEKIKSLKDKALEEDKAREAKRVSMVLASLEAYSMFYGGLSQLLATTDRKDKERRIAWKTAAIAEAGVNTAVGITKAYAQGGVLGFVTGAGVALAGAAQIETIRSQRFAVGGKIAGPAGGDQVLVRANPGERVITESGAANLESVLNGDGGATQNFYFQPKYNSDTPDSVKQRDYNEFARIMKTTTENPSFARTQASYT
jgi:hypothetical protein